MPEAGSWWDGEVAERIAATRLEHLVAVREPLVLIGHKGRSGGTLLTQMLDGHPQLHVHPFELEFGRSPSSWPAVDVEGNPEDWFGLLAERHVREGFARGYAKGAGREQDPQRFPLLLPPSLQREIFHEVVRRDLPTSQRDVYDAFLTSYFNAWLDNQNLVTTQAKRWVVAHRSALARSREARERFLATYPDGRLIAPVREPQGWYASARRLHRHHANDLDAAVASWLDAALETLHAVRRHPGRVLVVPFERLLLDTDATMGSVADWLDIERHPCLAEPTFNRMPIAANSSFPVAGPGVRQEMASRWREDLTEAEQRRIDELAGNTHRELIGSHAAVK